MQNVAQKWTKRLVLIKVFIIGAISSILFIWGYCGTYAVTKEGACMVRHDAILTTLKEHLESGGAIPKSLSELASLENSDGFRLSWILSYPGLRYYPDAWNKPGRILLQSSVCGSYVVAFGDGTRARLSYWYYRPEEKQPDAVMSREERYLPIVSCINTPPVGVLFILLILSLVIVVIVGRIIKRRSAKA